MKHINNNTFGALPLFLKALYLCHTPYARTHFPTFKFPDFSNVFQVGGHPDKTLDKRAAASAAALHYYY